MTRSTNGYARASAPSYARVADSSSPTKEEEGAATSAHSRSYTAARLRQGPSPRHGPITDGELDEVVADYRHITREAEVRSPAKRRLIAMCVRIHGRDGFVELLTKEFARRGTARDLLGAIRLMEPVDEWGLAELDRETPAPAVRVAYVPESHRDGADRSFGRGRSESGSHSDVLFSDAALELPAQTSRDGSRWP